MLLYVILLILIKESVGCVTYYNTDIFGNDCGHVSGKSVDSCCDICTATPGCKAYAWSEYSGGTCWLKSSASPLVSTPGITTGILATCSPLATNTDIVGSDLKSVANPNASACCDICANTTKCVSFAWNAYKGGTCWLKSATGPTIAKSGVTSSTLSASAGPSAGPSASPTPSAGPSGFGKLVFSQDFNSASDLSMWNPFVGTAWNNEQQYYKPENIKVENGNLVITAMQSGSQITSGRMETKGHFSFQYGFVEVRAKAPVGNGLWPAIWFMPDTGGWPQAGEIDLMENKGQDPTTIFGTVHFADQGVHKMYGTTTQAPPGGEFHIYTMKWTATQIDMMVDGKLFMSVNKNQIPSWPFIQKFFIIVNLAVGGDFVGGRISSLPKPVEFVIDYIRVWT